MPDQDPARRRIDETSYGSHAFRRFRRGLVEASRHEVPPLPSDVLFSTIVALLAAIGLAFAPWVRYELRDGTVVTESGIRGDGLVMVVAALIAIVALLVARRGDPGDASLPALIGFGACVAALLAPTIRMMDPGYIMLDAVSPPVPLSRPWGLVGSFLMMLVATWGAFRLWRLTDRW